jgi:hypothetical protein
MNLAESVLFDRPVSSMARRYPVSAAGKNAQQHAEFSAGEAALDLRGGVNEGVRERTSRAPFHVDLASGLLSRAFVVALCDCVNVGLELLS